VRADYSKFPGKRRKTRSGPIWMRGRVRVQEGVQVQHHWEEHRSIEIEAMWAGERMAGRWGIAKWKVVRLLEELSVTWRLEGCIKAQIRDREERIDLDVRLVDRILVFAGKRGLDLLDRPFRRCAAYRQSQGSHFQQDD
jgi:hypothetical protein